jgi:hypothetical protein
MSNYRDLSIDFPQRCLEVLELADEAATAAGREVTLLYMTLSAALLVPLERLGEPRHPSKEREMLGDAASALASELGKPFLKSAFAEPAGSNESGWGIGTLKPDDERVRGWPEHHVPTNPLEGQPAGQILRGIRNSLAHGNSYAVGDPIEALVFMSEIRSKDCQRQLEGYRLLRASPQDLRWLLQRWCEFLRQHHIRQPEAAKLLDAA